MNRRAIATLLSAAAALAVPATAAHGSGREKPVKKPKTVTFIFKGTFTAPGTLAVTAGNAHVRKGGFVGRAVTFDAASARIVAADTNADGKVDLTDVKDGDAVLVQARIAKGTTYAASATAAPITARRLIDTANDD